MSSLEPWQQRIMDENQQGMAELHAALERTGLLGELSREAREKLELMARGNERATAEIPPPAEGHRVTCICHGTGYFPMASGYKIPCDMPRPDEQGGR